ncbi:hypothetical protein Y027_758 [Burkholderia pseudomallei TSV5]|nr:hypothetical protein DO64_66 [Burkholderia pseudomallei]KGX56947.1 hypothetical protein Y027_758 [Burkholderia pseudomallei TSV5]
MRQVSRAAPAGPKWGREGADGGAVWTGAVFGAVGAVKAVGRVARGKPDGRVGGIGSKNQALGSLAR